MNKSYLDRESVRTEGPIGKGASEYGRRMLVTGYKPTFVSKVVHYWTGRGTLCSLDNNVRQQPNHSADKASVTCTYCLNQIALNVAKPR